MSALRTRESEHLWAHCIRIKWEEELDVEEDGVIVASAAAGQSLFVG